MKKLKTYSGKTITLPKPFTEEISIVDIAHGLSHLNRYAGQLAQPLNVAQHSLIVAELVSQKFPKNKSMQLAALLHDAPEAYLADVPSPVKHFCRDYQTLEKVFNLVIAKRFNLFPTLSEQKWIRYFDTHVRDVELKHKRLTATEAKAKFLEKYMELTGDE